MLFVLLMKNRIAEVINVLPITQLLNYVTLVKPIHNSPRCLVKSCFVQFIIFTRNELLESATG